MGTSDDVAKIIKFLTSNESEYITGQSFIVDGGLHLLSQESIINILKKNKNYFKFMSFKYKWFKPFETVSKPKQIDPKLLSKKTMGKYSIDLEKKLKKILKVKYVVLTNSGTSALMMANLALGINKNTKIITTNLSWIATINPSIILGSKIFLVDTEPYSQRINFKTLNKMIKKVKPNIVILSHLSGAAHIDREFVRLKKKYSFKVIEDAAQSFLHKFKKNKFFNTLFEVGCFSLSITKIVNMVYGDFVPQIRKL